MRAQSAEQLGAYEGPPLIAKFPVNGGEATRRNSGAATLVPRGRALFWQGEQQGQNIQIEQGVVRAVRLIENGNRQVLAFFWPGDVVRPARASCQHYTAEAVTSCRVIKYNATNGVCTRSDQCGAHQVLEETLSLVLMMGQKNSVARVASLLLRIRRHLQSKKADRASHAKDHSVHRCQGPSRGRRGLRPGRIRGGRELFIRFACCMTQPRWMARLQCLRSAK